jgi:hypothetical protein
MEYLRRNNARSLHCPLLGNDLINVFPLQQMRTQEFRILLEAVCCTPPLPRLYTEDLEARCYIGLNLADLKHTTVQLTRLPL